MSATNSIRILLVDDHAIVRAGFKMLLESVSGIHIVAEAERAEMALQLYLDYQPDVIVMDLSMPGIGGLEGIRRLRARHPDAKILVFSVHDEAVYVSRAMTAGATGYINKNSAPELLVQAIQYVARGVPFIEAGTEKRTHPADLRNPEIDYKQLINNLSAKEFDIFCLLAKGLTARKIADELCLGYKTVANYGTQIKAKFAVSSVAELTRIATAYGIINNQP
ncbi:MAG: response regulator transcription factor [Gammaproteobacteria bacterium]|nr:response regulator transcription factor [Gammaproteobacteria bacterium]